jgi:hypothetical protein
MRSCAVLAFWLGASGCQPEVFFPEDYATAYREVRRCQQSSDHELNAVRVLADPAAAEVYLSRDAGFAVGAVVLKAEYEFGDTTCAGPLKQLTVMRRVVDGGSPATLDWDWQTVDPRRTVTQSNDTRCTGCHAACGHAPDGFEATCGM